MLKKILLGTILLTTFQNMQADDKLSSFWGAFFGSLFGNNANHQPNQPVTIVPVPVPMTATILGRCACGATARKYSMIKLGCCGATVCESCWGSRVQTALHSGLSPQCHACGKTFNYINQALSSNTFGSESFTQISHNNRTMCASGCHSISEIKLDCGHGMCKSCLRSRKANAIKIAKGYQPHVTCPICGDMLTLKTIIQV